jgi:hypothetical protein
MTGSVFLAHHRELWGAALMTGDVATPLDFRELRDCGIVCAVVGYPPSSGVLVDRTGHIWSIRRPRRPGALRALMPALRAPAIVVRHRKMPRHPRLGTGRLERPVFEPAACSSSGRYSPLVELGWASAMAKPIVLVLNPGVSYSPLVMGLDKVTAVRTVELNDDWRLTCDQIELQINRMVTMQGVRASRTR